MEKCRNRKSMKIHKSLLGNWWTCVLDGSRKSTAQNGGVLNLENHEIVVTPSGQRRTATKILIDDVTCSKVKEQNL